MKKNYPKISRKDLIEIQNDIGVAQNKLNAMIQSFVSLEDIIKFVKKRKVISTAQLQREFYIGYVVTHRFIDKLVKLHYIKKSEKILSRYIVIKNKK